MKLRLPIFLLVLLAFFSGQVSAQERTVSGTVSSSEDGGGIPGVSVVVKGTSTGAITDIDGNYRLSVPGDNTTLIFSYLGFKTQEVEVGGQSKIDITLELDDQLLDEVVVVAYGETSKKKITGAIGGIDAETIQNQQVTSVTQLLQGTTPGVNIINGSGQPGANPTIRIRGVASVNANASPLIVLDGVVYNGNLNSINPGDIESFNTLKDASAAALYGSRAANGVLLITTKSGKAGKPRIDVNTSFGISQRAIPEYDFLSQEDFMELSWEAVRNNGRTIEANQGQIVEGGVTFASPEEYATATLISTNLRYNPYGVDNPVGIDGQLVGVDPLWSTDWESLLNRDDATRKEASIGISGGSENMKYYFSTAYLDQEGMTITSKFERINTRLNLDGQLNDWLSMGMRTGFTYSDQNFPNQAGSSFANNIQYIRSVPSIYPLYLRDGAGNLVLDASGDPQYDYGDNPNSQSVNAARPVLNPSNLVAETLLNTLRRERTTTTLNGYLQADFLKDFSFRSNFAVDYYVFDRFDYDEPTTTVGRNVGGRVERRRNATTGWTWFNKLAYSKRIGDHNIEVMGIHEKYNFAFRSLRAQTTGYVAPGIEELTGAVNELTTSTTNQERISSWLGKATYGFKDRYFLDISARTDQSSRFSPETRRGNFYSIGGSWVISDEVFMQNVPVLTFAKLRASYGELGNQDIRNASDATIVEYFPYIDAFATGYDDTSYPGVLVPDIRDPRISWETVKNLNIGLDFGLLEDRITGTVEWYRKDTEDALFSNPIAPSTGVSNVFTNLGSIRNSGVEILLNTVNLRTPSGFTWETMFNIAFERNEFTKLPQDSIVQGSKQWKVGKGIYDFYVEEWAGVDPADGMPQWYADSLNAEGDVVGRRITKEYAEATRYYQGSALPDARGGVTNRFTFKGVDFSFLVSYSIGGQIYDGDYAGLMHGFRNVGNQAHADLLNRWQEPGDITDVPKITTANLDVTSRSTRYLFDNTYLRLRNVTLGYTFSNDLLQRTGGVIRSLRVYMMADNILTLSERDGLDPESSITGVTNSRSTPFKTYSIGLNIGL